MEKKDIKKEKIEKKKIGIKNLVLLIVVVTVVAFFFLYTVGETKTHEGDLVKLIYTPKSNAPGNDALLLFNNSGTINYVVINEYKSGIMLELEYNLNKNIWIEYKYFNMQDKNVIIGYQVI